MKLNRSRLLVAAAAALFACSTSSLAADDKPEPKKSETKKEKKRERYAEMDYGPFLTASIISDPRAKFDNGPGSFSGDSTARGIAIKLSDDWRDGIVFDMDLMRVSAGWMDGSLKLVGLISNGDHGPGPTIGVPPLFQTPHLPGWAGPDGTFNDPRPNSIDPLPPPGPLPRDFAHYRGLYRHGDRVVLSYSVGSVGVLESASLAKNEKTKAIIRTIRIEKTDKPLSIMLADAEPVYPFPGAKKPDPIRGTKTGQVNVGSDGTSASVIDANFALVTGATAGARLEASGSQLILKVPASNEPITLQLFIGGGDKAD